MRTMKNSPFINTSLCRWIDAPKLSSRPLDYTCIFCQPIHTFPRRFATSARRYHGEARQKNRGPFRTRLRSALRDTKVEWRPIPIGLGITFLGAAQFYRGRQREKRRKEEEEEHEQSQSEAEKSGKPTKRKRIRPSGPW